MRISRCVSFAEKLAKIRREEATGLFTFRPGRRKRGGRQWAKGAALTTANWVRGMRVGPLKFTFRTRISGRSHEFPCSALESKSRRSPCGTGTFEKLWCAVRSALGALAGVEEEAQAFGSASVSNDARKPIPRAVPSLISAIWVRIPLANLRAGAALNWKIIPLKILCFHKKPLIPTWVPTKTPPTTGEFGGRHGYQKIRGHARGPVRAVELDLSARRDRADNPRKARRFLRQLHPTLCH